MPELKSAAAQSSPSFKFDTINDVFTNLIVVLAQGLLAENEVAKIICIDKVRARLGKSVPAKSRVLKS